MASVLKDVNLRINYDFGLVEGKKVIKTKTFANINKNVADEDLLTFADALFAVQTNRGELSKVAVTTLSR